MTHPYIAELMLITAVLASTAIVGLTVGKLLRGTLPVAPTPRTARAREYLYACHNPRMTSQSRISCACESLYFCCVDIADRIGLDVAPVDHPDRALLEAATQTLDIPKADVDTVFALLDWRLYPIPSNPPPCTQEVAWSVAKRIYVKTLRFLGT